MPGSARFRKVLVANRGEIAVRIIRACHALGLASVAVYSDADRDALHVRLADEAERIGPAPVGASYLNAAALLEAARRRGAEAVHPGYGFLSEQASFAEAVERAGLVWVGPPPAAMRLLGDKIAARRLAESVGVPVVPGSVGSADALDGLERAAGAVGFPLLVKAAAGGGGRGMRLVQEPEALPEALRSAAREAQSAFGDGRLFLERYLAPVRHVEVQVLGDAHGNVVHLGERDCSVQRRHQKVIEEAPSPAVTPELRAALGAAAVRLARAAGYQNAGTVEFVLDDAGRFYFLEVNTRLQVEHPVTEEVTGLDLVQLQLRIAAGEPLPFSQEAVALHGHAIECRIYAEDPDNQFLPSSGRLTRFRPPPGPHYRHEVGVLVGAEVGLHYDPLLAKLVTRAASRDQAIEQALDALAEYEIEGVKTNLRLLREALGHPAFRAGEAHTDFLERYGLPRRWTAEDFPLEVLAAVAGADLLAAARSAWPVLGDAPPPEGSVLDRAAAAGGPFDPWRAGAWRLGRVELPLRYRLENGVELELRATQDPERPERWRFRLGARELDADLAYVEVEGEARVVLRVGAEQRQVGLRPRGARGAWEAVWRDERFLLRPAEPPDPERLAVAPHDGHERRRLAAPMPGKVVRVLVRAGDAVRPKQVLVVLEAMKIEHLIEAPHAGTVTRVACREGDVVPLGATLVELEER